MAWISCLFSLREQRVRTNISFYAYWGDLQAVRWGDWKLRIADGKEALYNLAEDISEKKNLAAENPEIVEKLKIAMKDFKSKMAKEVRPAGLVENPKVLTLGQKD